jgi:hypothetical protein
MAADCDRVAGMLLQMGHGGEVIGMRMGFEYPRNLGPEHHRRGCGHVSYSSTSAKLRRIAGTVVMTQVNRHRPGSAQPGIRPGDADKSADFPHKF